MKCKDFSEFLLYHIVQNTDSDATLPLLKPITCSNLSEIVEKHRNDYVKH